MAKHEHNPTLSVRFYNTIVEDVAASKKAGRPIMKDFPMVKINWGGDDHNKRELHAPANDWSDRDDRADNGDNIKLRWFEAFPREWEMFQKNQEQTVDGTPLSEAPFLTEAKREEMRRINIFTVEALASMEGSHMKTLGMGGRDLKEKAEAYLARAKGVAVDAIHKAEMDAMAKRLADLEAKLSAGAAPAQAVKEDSSEDAQARAYFDGLDDETLKLWLSDAKVNVPGNWGKKRMVAEAVKINAEARKAKVAAE